MNEQRYRWILGTYAEFDDKRVWFLIFYTALNSCLHWDCSKHQPQRHPVSSPQCWGSRLFVGNTSAFPCAVWCGLYIWLHNQVRHPPTHNHLSLCKGRVTICDAGLPCPCRLDDAANCSRVTEILLSVLRGPNYPQYVSSFGNSPLDSPMDWVPIKSNFNTGVSTDHHQTSSQILILTRM